jgi:hypothetical protein
MPSLAAVRSKSVPVDPIKMYGETWNVSYHPGVLTPDFEQEMLEVQSKMMRLQRDAEAATDDKEAAALEKRAKAIVKKFWDLLTQMIAEWDVTEAEDGPPLPVSAETFQKLPSPLLAAFVDAIREGAQTGKATESGSPSGSGSETGSEEVRLTSIS